MNGPPGGTLGGERFELGGEWTVDPPGNRLLRGSEQVLVEPLCMDLLVYLAERAGEVASQQEIVDAVWRGQVVGDDSIYQAVARLRRALGDTPARPRYIATVPKRGYRLVAEVACQRRRDAAAPPTAARHAGARRRRAMLAAGVLAVTVLIAAALWLRPQAPPPARTYHSLAVLPFDSLSADPADGYLAEGLSEELMLALGDIEGLRVVSRISAHAARAVTEDLRAVADLLDVDAVIEGTVRRDGDDLRVTAKLVDGDDGFEVWRGRYDRQLDDVFALQARLAAQVASAVHGTIRAGPASGTKPASIEAYDYVLLGRHYQRLRTGPSLRRSTALFRRALALEPVYPEALRQLATSELLLAYYGDRTLDEALALAEPLIERAMTADPGDARGLAIRGLAQHLGGDSRQARTTLDRVVRESPNHAEAWMWLGLALEDQGLLREANARYAEAVTLDPLSVVAQVNLAYSVSHLGDTAGAARNLEWLARTLSGSPQLHRALAILAIERGDIVSGYREARRAHALDPDGTLTVALLAQAESLAGRSGAALDDARRVLTADHVVPYALHLLTFLLLNEGRLDELYAMSVRHAALAASQDMSMFGRDEGWHRARIGFARYALGDDGAALDDLGLALAQTERAPVVRSDYDPTYCAALAHVHRREGRSDAVAAVLTRCRALVATARDHGWDTPWLHYAEAGLAAIEGRPEEAAAALERAFEDGLRGAGLIRHNRMFDELEDRVDFIAVLDKMEAQSEAARAALERE